MRLYTRDPIHIQPVGDTLRGQAQRIDANLEGIESAIDALGYDYVTFTISGSGAAIDPEAVNAESPWWVAGYPGIIKEAFLLAHPDHPGSIQLDIWKAAHADFPPTDANSICAGHEPAIISGIKAIDAVLEGWITTFAAGDVFMFHVDSASLVRRVTLTLKMQITA